MHDSGSAGRELGDFFMLLDMLLMLYLVENVMFGSTSPDSVGVARFACQSARFVPSSYYVSRPMFLLLVGSVLPHTHCFAGD